MIGRKNKGPSLAIATSALGGTGGVFSSIGAPLGFITGYLSGLFETLGGIIPSASTGISGALGTSAGSLLPSFVGSALPRSASILLDSFSSSGVTSFPITSLVNSGRILEWPSYFISSF